MAAKSTYLANAIGNMVVRNVAYSQPSVVYLALFTNAASLAGLIAGTQTGEVSNSGTNYTRQAITFSAFSSGTSGNSAPITFLSATAGWGNVTFAAISDSGSWNGGNILYAATLSSVQTINTGNTLSIGPSLITLTET